MQNNSAGTHIREALLFNVERVMKFKTYEGQMNENDRIYEKLTEMADRYDGEDEEQDYYQNVERIWSAVYCAIDQM